MLDSDQGSSHSTVAIALLDQVVADDPRHAAALTLRAQAHLALGDSTGALDDARRAIRVNPLHPASQMTLALAAWKTERYTLAQQSYQRAADLTHRDPEVLAQYAQFMAEVRGPKLAADAARDAIDADDDSVLAWSSLALAQFKMHQLGEADTSLRRAMSIDPDDRYARSLKALLLFHRGQYEQAEALVDQFGDDPLAAEFVAGLREDLKQRALAANLFSRPSVQKVLFRGPSWWQRRGLPVAKALLAFARLLLWWR